MAASTPSLKRCDAAETLGAIDGTLAICAAVLAVACSTSARPAATVAGTSQGAGTLQDAGDSTSSGNHSSSDNAPSGDQAAGAADVEQSGNAADVAAIPEPADGSADAGASAPDSQGSNVCVDGGGSPSSDWAVPSGQTVTILSAADFKPPDPALTFVRLTSVATATDGAVQVFGIVESETGQAKHAAVYAQLGTCGAIAFSGSAPLAQIPWFGDVVSVAPDQLFSAAGGESSGMLNAMTFRVDQTGPTVLSKASWL